MIQTEFIGSIKDKKSVKRSASQDSTIKQTILGLSTGEHDSG